MATTIRHVTLKSLGKNKDIDPSKGTVVNPFTQEEYNSLCNTGEWLGGYVEAMGYVAPPMMDGMSDGSGSGSSDTNFKTYKFDNNGSIESIETNSDTTDIVKFKKITYRVGGSLSILEDEVSYDEKDESLTRLSIGGGTIALYKFLCDNIRREFQALHNGGHNPSDSVGCIISTTHQTGSFTGTPIPGYNTMTHSHPFADSKPSKNDIDAIAPYSNAGYSYFNIYKNNNFVAYNANSATL